MSLRMFHPIWSRRPALRAGAALRATGARNWASFALAGAALGALTACGGGKASPPAAPSTACSGAPFCDDFESDTLGQTPNNFQAHLNLGLLSVDTTRAHSGHQAVKFSVESGTATKTAFMRLASVFPVDENHFFGRMHFYLEAAPTASVHWTFIQAGGTVTSQGYHALYRYGGQLPVAEGSQLMANYDTPDSYSGTGPSSDCWNHAAAIAVPVGTWSCAEWEFDGSSDTLRFWLDESAVPSLTVSGVGQGCVHQSASYEWTAPNFEYLDLGWESYQADDPRTLYVDDVAISKTKIGCSE